MITNKQLKEVVALRDKSKARREAGLYIVEGIRMFKEVPKDILVSTYVTKSFFEANKDEYDLKSAEIVDDSTFSKMSDTKTPQGVLCVCRQQPHRLEDIVKKGDEPALYMVLEDIQDPGNLGTIFRTGEAAGVKAIIMSKGCVDIYNPKTIRSTMGSIYRVPFVYVDDLADGIKSLKDANVTVYAAHLKGTSNYDEIKYSRSAFMIGNEGNGLKEDTARLADTYLKIPMAGNVESLNAAVAATVLMFEHGRQIRLFT